jgi:serine/threonine-protein kinase
MTTTNDPLVGTTFDGRYRVEKRIGSGGMANVYLAEDETLGRRVAIKVLHQRYADDSQFVERFLREASAAARLNHPNIVQVYDRGHADGTYYIAMEYVDGMTLKDLVRRRGGLTEQEVLAYGRQALHALRFAHRNGIVHRDVKPHNMMVDTDGRLKIADFGIARAAADAERGLTEAGSIVGTAQYLSPEQAQGHDVSAPSDLYSLGVVMYEMATGRVPFDGDSPVNVALKHVKDPVRRPSALNPEVSPQLESIVLKAMEKDPASRYHSADEMLADLDRAREGGQTSAMTAVLGGAAIGGAAGAAAATRVTPITPTPARAYETPVPPEPAWPDDDEDRSGGRKAWKWVLPLLVVVALAAVAAYLLIGGDKGTEVPDVVGQRLAQARAEVIDAGFKVGEVSYEASASEDEGTVLEQSPDGGDEADEGSEVDLVVSSGPETVEVTDVVGVQRKTAIAQLQGDGFKVREAAREASDTVKAGFVIRQDPGGGEKAAPGATITIVVSSGPEQQAVPSVVGLSESDARAKLEAEPLNLVVEVDTVDSSKPAGTVISQSPTANTRVEPGSTVTLQVASGNNAVPDVGGQSEADATSALQAQGFRVEVVEQPTDDPSSIGVVLATDPTAGSVTSVGTTVTVTVGVEGDGLGGDTGGM